MAAGPEPEFPLWLGLISLPLTFLGDPCWFPPTHTLVLEPRRREIPQGWGLEAGCQARAGPGGLGQAPWVSCLPSVHPHP